MVGLTSLWLPILLAAVFVFVASCFVHMVFRYHRTDFAKLPYEDKIRAAMNQAGVDPGNYQIPYASSRTKMGERSMKQKFVDGPVGFVNICPSGSPGIGKNILLWFAYTLFASLCVAYVVSLAAGEGADYRQVFRIASVVGFLVYAGAAPTEAIWKGRKWSTTAKALLDGLIYGVVTAGTFGWLWPR